MVIHALIMRDVKGLNKRPQLVTDVTIQATTNERQLFIPRFLSSLHA